MSSFGGAATWFCAAQVMAVGMLVGCRRDVQHQPPQPQVQGNSMVTPLMRASSDCDLAAVERLIRQRANVNVADDKGATALHYAHCGDIRVVRALLAAGADINARTPHNVTPLMSAVSMAGGSPASALELIRAGADVNVADSDGSTALWVATTESDVSVVRALLEAGADPNVQSRSLGFWGYTPLHMAAMNGLIEAAEVLLQHGADVTIRNGQGQTALDVANDKWPAMRALLAKHVRTVR